MLPRVHQHATSLLTLIGRRSCDIERQPAHVAEQSVRCGSPGSKNSLGVGAPLRFPKINYNYHFRAHALAFEHLFDDRSQLLE